MTATTNAIVANPNGSSGTGGNIAIKDEGTTAVATASAINFVGAGVSATDGGGGTATVTISSGGSAIAIKEEGTTVVATPSTINFVGAGVTATDGGGGTATITIPGGGGGSYVGDYASAAALQSGAPAASNDGNIGTVNNSLYMSDGVAWRALVTYVSSLAYAEGSPLPATYTQAQLDALLLGRGNVISRASRPIIRPSSGNMTNSTGLITMNTGLNASWTIPGSSMPCWIYLPGGTVPGYGSAQLHAGTITSATTVQLTGVTGATVAGYTTDASNYLPLHSFTLTGNEFGANGELEIVVKSTHAGTMTSAHEIQFQIGGTTFGGTSNNAVSYISRVSTGRLVGRGKDAASQIGMWDSTAGSTANTAQDVISTFLTVDTTSNQTVGVYLKAPVGSTVVLDMVRATLWKG